MSPQVHDDPERSWYEARVDDRRAGVAAYRLRDGVITFTHTVVEDAYESQGIGGALARAALDDPGGGGWRSCHAAPSSQPGSSVTPTTPTSSGGSGLIPTFGG